MLILDKNPLENIRNSNSIQFVIKNGRMYEGNTLNETYPSQKKMVKEWNDQVPVVTTSVKQ
jgi:hypothetical protein